MTSENYPEDLHQGRGWLNRAAEMLDSCEDHVSDAEFARAAAAIGNGFIQLAAVERTTAWRAEDLARWTADREAERENDEVVRETNRLILARERGELALVEQRTSALAALDVAALAASGQREKRAEAEALPHDDEPKPPRCTGCFGPFSDGSHAVNCTQRCQDCGGDDAENSPRRCRCREGQPAAPLCGCPGPGHEITCPDFQASTAGEVSRG